MVDAHYQNHKYELLPEGLTDLMDDITREVLRAQPENVCGFIAHYLGAMLRVRDAVTIAEDVCNLQCACSVEKALKQETIDKTVEEIEQYSNVGQEMSTAEISKEMLTVYEPGNCQNTQDTQNDEQFDGNTIERGFWSPSTYSLAGSYMHLPKYTPYSVHEYDISEDINKLTTLRCVTTSTISNDDNDLSNNNDHDDDEMQGETKLGILKQSMTKTIRKNVFF